MARAFLLVMDSVGCGHAPDAAVFGDEGANTLGHIVEACAQGKANRSGLRHGPLHVPFMNALGLEAVLNMAAGRDWKKPTHPHAQFGVAAETSKGKDTPSGHWEIAGAPVDFEWGYFPLTIPALPQSLTEAMIAQGHLPGVLGNCHSAGLEIIERFGEEHVRTGKPIVYTSVDSVVQIAAHEDVFGRQRLYDLCALTRTLCDPLRIGRVIARPFVGEAGNFQRTPFRKDFSIPPPHGTLLDRAAAQQRAIVTLGKIGDIFGHRNTGTEITGADNNVLFDALLTQAQTLPDGGLLFANFVDFDTDFGHRRDVAGYAGCLENFDRRLPELEPHLRPDDLVILTGDHGNDPSWSGTDHTRELVPILAFGPSLQAKTIGHRHSFCDIGESVAAHLHLSKGASGESW